jgi:hypothetical protein
MKALTLNNIIVQIEDDEFEVSPPLLWRDCSENEERGDVWNDGWEKPAAPADPIITADMIRQEARNRMQLNGHDLAVQGSVPNQDSLDYIDAIKSECATLEGTLPQDYKDDSHWTAAP